MMSNVEAVLYLSMLSAMKLLGIITAVPRATKKKVLSSLHSVRYQDKYTERFKRVESIITLGLQDIY